MSAVAAATHPALASVLARLDDAAVQESWLTHAAESGLDVAAGGEEVAWLAERTAQESRVVTAFGRYLSGLPARYAGASLDDLDGVADKDGRGVGELVRRWLRDPLAQHLLLAGPPGVGKTYAAVAASSAAAAEVAWAGTPGEFPVVWSVAGLLDALRPSARDAEAAWVSAKSVSCLVLDDLAHTRPTEWAIERMWMLADTRTACGLRTVVTTNASWASLVATWGAPTMDRFRDRSVTVVLEGQSLRKPAW